MSTLPASPDKTRRKVFLVDDHALVREWLGNLIHKQSDLMVCGEADGVTAALAGIEANHPDLAVVDISLKDLSGIELIKSLKQSHPELAVLVLSMHEEERYAERALRAGAEGYITKREAAREVISAIRQVLDGTLYLSESVRQSLTLSMVKGKAAGDVPSVEKFSDRELEVFELLGQGQNTVQIAQRLQINAKTVHTYCARMREKMELKNSTELLREAFHWNETHRPQ